MVLPVLVAQVGWAFLGWCVCRWLLVMAFSGRVLQMDIPVELVSGVDKVLEQSGWFRRRQSSAAVAGTGGGPCAGRALVPQPPIHPPPLGYGQLEGAARSRSRRRRNGKEQWKCDVCGYDNYARNWHCRRCSGTGAAGSLAPWSKERAMARHLNVLERAGQWHASVVSNCLQLGLESEDVWTMVKSEKRSNGQPRFMGAKLDEVEHIALAKVVQKNGMAWFQFID